MQWGAAFRAVILPALVIGPLMGILGAIVPFAFAAALGAGGVGYVGFMVAAFGAVIGLIVATPTCLILGMVLFNMALGNEAWLGRGRWAAIGVAGGFAIGAFFSIIIAGSDLLAALPILGGIGAALGATGGFLCHLMVAKKIALAKQVDTSVFE